MNLNEDDNGDFERTIELDASYAAAYSGLADTYLLLNNYGNMTVATAVEKASPLIQTALQLDGQMSEGFASLGLMYWILGRSTAGEAHLRRAVKLDPENTVAMNWLAGLIGSQGRRDVGERKVQITLITLVGGVSQLVFVKHDAAR